MFTQPIPHKLEYPVFTGWDWQGVDGTLLPSPMLRLPTL